MSSARRYLVEHISLRRRSAGLSDEAFAAAVGIGVDELNAFEAGEAPLPAEILAVMLEVIATCDEGGAGPGFREDAVRPLLASDASDDRFAQSLQLLRDFTAIESASDRQEILHLAAARAARGRA